MSTEATIHGFAAPTGQSKPSKPSPPATEVSRRTVLRRGVLGAATIVVAGSGVASYRVFDTRALDPGAGSAYDAWSRWKEPGPLGMVGAAILAANPHNAQAWRFHVTEAGTGTAASIDVFADLARTTGTVDGLQRELFVGLGCALENLVLAARARGYHAELTLLPDSDPTHVGHLTLFSPATPATSPLYEAIGRRHSNRGPYQDRPVTSDVLAALAAHAHGGPATLRWLTTPAERAAMSALMVDAARTITEDERQSRDAFAWFRSSADAIDKHQDGLTLDGQGLTPVMTALAKMLPASTRTAGDAFWLNQTRDVHTKTAAAYGVTTVPAAADPRTRLAAGRVLQRIHLDIARRGMALQHMNQITERIDREAALGVSATFGPKLAALLGRSAGEALVSFRVGYPSRPARLSPRRPVTQVQR